MHLRHLGPAMTRIIVSSSSLTDGSRLKGGLPSGDKLCGTIRSIWTLNFKWTVLGRQSEPGAQFFCGCRFRSNSFISAVFVISGGLGWRLVI